MRAMDAASFFGGLWSWIVAQLEKWVIWLFGDLSWDAIVSDPAGAFAKLKPSAFIARCLVSALVVFAAWLILRYVLLPLFLKLLKWLFVPNGN